MISWLILCDRARSLSHQSGKNEESLFVARMGKSVLVINRVKETLGPVQSLNSKRLFMHDGDRQNAMYGICQHSNLCLC